MAILEVARLDPATAAQLLAGEHVRDPRGVATPDDLARMCEQGLCFAATHPETGSQAVYVLVIRNGQAWVNACKGSGAVDFTSLLLPAIELQASKLDSVAFQTARRGLVKKATRQGYKVTGWILKKDMREGKKWIS